MGGGGGGGWGVQEPRDEGGRGWEFTPQPPRGEERPPRRGVSWPLAPRGPRLAS